MKVEKRLVFCVKCKNEFESTTSNPRCWKCRSRAVYNVEDIPKQYAKKDLEIAKRKITELKVQMKELKKSEEFNLKTFKKLIIRIKNLEANTPTSIPVVHEETTPEPVVNPEIELTKMEKIRAKIDSTSTREPYNEIH